MLTFAEAARQPQSRVGAESHRLAAQESEVPGGMVVPAAFEEGFYRGTNLPEQIRRLFSVINPARIDEDHLEALCGRAQELVRTNYLLDDAVQVFYRALANAGLAGSGLAGVAIRDVHLRRPGELHTESAHVMPPGTAALHALKRLWTSDWTFEAVLTRLDDTGGVGLDARPTLILPGPPGVPDSAKAAALGVPVALVNGFGVVGLL
jgi:hypothetical protein